MSPEQARGLPVDKRTDIWAFGCVLYEMLTGRVAFPGDTISDSIAKILEREPDWSALPAATPAPIRRLLLRCLAKDPKQRLRDIGDVRIEIDAIDEVLPATPDVQGAPAAPANASLKWLPWVALIALAAGVVAWEAWRRVPIEVAGNPLANATFARRHRLGGHGRAGGHFARWQVRHVRRRQGWRVRRLGESSRHREVSESHPRWPPHGHAGKSPAKSWVQWRRVGDLVQPRG